MVAAAAAAILPITFLLRRRLNPFHRPHRHSSPAAPKSRPSSTTSMHSSSVGITLSDAARNLPGRRFIWELNFSDFDISSDDYAPNSINLLRNQGVDFEHPRKFSVGSARMLRVFERAMEVAVERDPMAVYDRVVLCRLLLYKNQGWAGK
ncbi:Probable CCR4-associated factor 1 homolog 11 [Striga hermonthica]|uniref:Probable CCR4-associated factor 1 homolog 11 n=1 Tax=Striga hermonthica TaxID=68872 RepID=A0A9N7N3I8_STRHE|nr:Probable CCR4-associated factor 1 homolog 11 [Striga hermonthica]